MFLYFWKHIIFHIQIIILFAFYLHKYEKPDSQSCIDTNRINAQKVFSVTFVYEVIIKDQNSLKKWLHLNPS